MPASDPRNAERRSAEASVYWRAMRASLMLLFLACAGGCQAPEPTPPPPQIVSFRVFGAPKKPVAGAELFFNGSKVATTDASGFSQIKLAGKDGDAFDITVRCPSGHHSPEKPVQVALKRSSDAAKNPEYTTTCPPMMRNVVVAVRAENGPNLPITYLGREVARTDGSGAAHVLLKLQAGDQFDLTLNTSGEQNESLRPQNPTASFIVGQRDDVFNFDQKFERAPERPGARRGFWPQRSVKMSN